MAQEQKTNSGGDPSKGPNQKHKDDADLAAKAKKAEDMLKKLDEAQKKKKGHYEECCGVRVWVED